jgi:phospholipid/cholesterol/gamma-HCH transport system permease protein
MPRDLAPSLNRRSTSPLQFLFAVLAYAGAPLGILSSACRALIRPGIGSPPLRQAVLRRLDELIRLAGPLTVLVHVPLGSFLAMQAYYNATFTQAVGAVAGLGLLRNLGPIATGLTLAGFLSARYVPELINRPRFGLDDAPEAVPDREVALGHSTDSRSDDDPGRLALVRILSAAIAGPILCTIGLLVGIVLSIVVARSMLQIAPAIYLGKFLEMIRPIDVIGLIVKGILFATISAAVACAEGLRTRGSEPLSLPASVTRAACVSMLGVLFTNASWFTFAYKAGDPFGPLIGR